MDYLEEDKKYLWHPYTQAKTAADNLVVVKAKDAYLITDDGRQILDMISSWWVNTFGHANEQIANAIARQAKELEQVIFAGFTHPKAIELAKKLWDVLPDNQAKVFYSDNGSTSVEVALKMCWQYWKNKGVKKSKIIAFEGAYHGDTFGAMSASDRSVFTQAFDNLLFDVIHIPLPDSANFQSVKNAFLSHLINDDVACFIYEPLVQGAAGMRIYDAELLDELLLVARQHQVLLIADEVMTGMGRTGKNFANDYLQTKADVFCISKGITGGFMPFGITTCTQEIFDAFYADEAIKTLYHGHSYTANPLACAAAIESLILLQSNHFQLQINMISAMNETFCKKINADEKVQAKSLGTLLSIKIQQGDSGYLSNLRNVIYEYFLNKNILLRPLGNVLYLLPPYCVTQSQLEMVYNEIEDFVKSLK